MSITPTADPRIERTHRHVLSVAREILTTGSEAVSFTLLADRAQVSRRTLYVHWGTVENLIAETLVVPSPAAATGFDGLTLEQRASLFLERLATRTDTGAATALASTMASATHSEPAAAAVTKLNDEIFASFTYLVGTAADDVLVQILAPVLFLRMAGREVGDELIAELSARAAELVSPLVA